MARLAVYLNTALSMTSCASRWRSTGSFAAGRPSRDIRRASSSVAPVAISNRAWSPNPSASRSYMRVVIPTCQPWPSVPRMFSAGTRTFSKNTSLNSASPVIWRSGRTVMPGECMSTRK